MELWQALLLGVIQGITEFLPISSSGHLALVQNWLQIYPPPFYFDVFIHLISLIAIIYFFKKQIQRIFKNRDWRLVSHILIGSLPIFIAGFFIRHSAESLFSSSLIAGIGLLITAGLNLFTAQKYLKQKQEKKLNSPKALLVGIAQVFAIIPGISRSGSTLFGSSLTGISKTKTLEFSFLLAIPAILAANVFYILISIENVMQQLSAVSIPAYAAGGLICFFTSLASLKLLKKTLNNSKYHLFGWYCLVLGLGAVIHSLLS